MKVVESENTSIGIAIRSRGMILHAIMLRAEAEMETMIMMASPDAPRWTVTRMIPASPYWVFSNTGVMMIGWSSSSSMKECAFGLTKNTPS